MPSKYRDYPDPEGRANALNRSGARKSIFRSDAEKQVDDEAVKPIYRKGPFARPVEAEPKIDEDYIDEKTVARAASKALGLLKGKR